eukprot:100492_1
MATHYCKVLGLCLLTCITMLILSGNMIIMDMNFQSQTYITSLNNRRILSNDTRSKYPIIATTWRFGNATDLAWDIIQNTKDSLRAVVAGCGYCEMNPGQCNWSVGYGAKPDQTNQVSLDAMIMYAPTHDMGAVGQVSNIKNVIALALNVMKYTQHTMLVGEQVYNFAAQMGFQNESLNSNRSNDQYQSWLNNNCQPNFWRNVINGTIQCPPYIPIPIDDININEMEHIDAINGDNHDTIGMIAIDENGRMSCGASTNGLTYKINGRVGDTPIPGSGAYCEDGIGGAVATGNGDIMMRFNPTFTATKYMKFGMNVREACEQALREILRYYNESFSGALICMDYLGNIAAANYGSSSYAPFHFVYRDNSTNESVLVMNDPIELD